MVYFCVVIIFCNFYWMKWVWISGVLHGSLKHSFCWITIVKYLLVICNNYTQFVSRDTIVNPYLWNMNYVERYWKCFLLFVFLWWHKNLPVIYNQIRIMLKLPNYHLLTQIFFLHGILFTLQWYIHFVIYDN